MDISILDYHAIQANWHKEAIYPCEALYLCRRILDAEIDLCIECGSLNGYSSDIISKLTGVPVITLDFNGTLTYNSCYQMPKRGEVLSLKGDMHIALPHLLEHTSKAYRRICVFNDAAKGFEGLATLFKNAIKYQPALIAQHNLHEGHKSREVFKGISRDLPVFLEADISNIADYYHSDISHFSERQLNRQLYPTSLGVLDEYSISSMNITRKLLKSFGPYSPMLLNKDTSAIPYIVKSCKLLDKIFFNSSFR